RVPWQSLLRASRRLCRSLDGPGTLAKVIKLHFLSLQLNTGAHARLRCTIGGSRSSFRCRKDSGCRLRLFAVSSWPRAAAPAAALVMGSGTRPDRACDD